MNGFEQYDLQGWTASGLSFHPQPIPQVPSPKRPMRGYFTKFAVPIMAIGALTIVNTSFARTDANASAWRGASPSAKSSLVVAAAQGPSVVLAVRAEKYQPLSPVSEFDLQVADLVDEVRSGSFGDASAATMALAHEATSRFADTDKNGKPDWVDRVAKEVAKLTD